MLHPCPQLHFPPRLCPLRHRTSRRTSAATRAATSRVPGRSSSARPPNTSPRKHSQQKKPLDFCQGLSDRGTVGDGSREGGVAILFVGTDKQVTATLTIAP